MATADRMFYAGLDLPVQWWILYRGYGIAVLSVSAPKYRCWYWENCNSIPDKVCSALRYRNIDPLGRRHEYTGGFPRDVSATDTWCMLVSSWLQCRCVSAILWRLTSSTLISGHVACLESGVPTHGALRLMVDTYEGRKASWRRPPGRPRNVWLNKVQDDNALLLSTLWRSPGVTERRNGSFRLRDDDNDDDDDDDDVKLVLKIK